LTRRYCPVNKFTRLATFSCQRYRSGAIIQEHFNFIAAKSALPPLATRAPADPFSLRTVTTSLGVRVNGPNPTGALNMEGGKASGKINQTRQRSPCRGSSGAKAMERAT